MKLGNGRERTAMAVATRRDAFAQAVPTRKPTVAAVCSADYGGSPWQCGRTGYR